MEECTYNKPYSTTFRTWYWFFGKQPFGTPNIPDIDSGIDAISLVRLPLNEITRLIDVLYLVHADSGCLEGYYSRVTLSWVDVQGWVSSQSVSHGVLVSWEW